MRRSLLFSVMLVMLASLGVLSANAQTISWTGTDPATAAKDNSTVYLWNVAKQCFLEKGGRWGTEAVLGTATNGQAFTVESASSKYKLKTTIQKQDGTTNGYVTRMDTKGSTGDKLNYFVDQAGSSFTFTKSGSGYTISESSYYMCATRNSSSTSLSENAAIAINAITSSNKSNDVWILVTETERKNYFANSTKAGSANAGATFLIKDYDFARKDFNVSNWKIVDNNALVNGSYPEGTAVHSPADYTGTAATYTYTGSHYYYYSFKHDVTKTVDTDHGTSWETTCGGDTYHNSQDITLTKTSTKEAISGYTYYVGNGLGIDVGDQANNGGKWTANIHGASGKVYQTITVPVKGIYRIKCKGFTTVANAASLFATNSESKTSTQAFATNEGIDVTTASYVDAYTALQSSAYTAAVEIYADKDTEITFGVEVANGEDTGWASFDDFELEYIGTGDVKVILDETKESVDYLQAQNDNEKVKSNEKPTIYLHRSLTANKWNSIVLPFDLTADEVTSAFGARTIVSRFKGATDKSHPTRLYFEKDEKIEKDQLYLIKPTTEEKAGQENVEATATMSNGDKITLSGAYYTLNPQGGFYRADYNYPTDGKVGGTDSGNETYTGSTNLEFKGTYVKKANQIPANSYMLYAGAEDTDGSQGYWVYREKTSSSRAFRGWLQPKTETPAKGITFYINGIEAGGDETTGIEDALINTDSHSVSGNIYNLNGQMVRQNATSTEGLAKGVYIVGGKKVIVR